MDRFPKLDNKNDDLEIKVPNNIEETENNKDESPFIQPVKKVSKKKVTKSLPVEQEEEDLEKIEEQKLSILEKSRSKLKKNSKKVTKDEPQDEPPDVLQIARSKLKLKNSRKKTEKIPDILPSENKPILKQAEPTLKTENPKTEIKKNEENDDEFEKFAHFLEKYETLKEKKKREKEEKERLEMEKKLAEEKRLEEIYFEKFRRLEAQKKEKVKKLIEQPEKKNLEYIVIIFSNKMSSYANSADKINDKINMLNQKQFDNIADFETAANQKEQTKLDQEYEKYMKKYDEVKSIGEDDIAGLFGLKGAYQGYKKIKGVYNKYRNTGSGDDVNDLGNYIDRTVVGTKEIKNPAFDPDSLTSTASDAANTGASDVSQVLSQASNNVSNAVSSASNAASQASNAASQATSDVSNAASQASNAVSNATSQATSDVSNAASQASNAVSNATSDASNAFSNLAGDTSNPYSLTTFLKKLPQPKFTDPGVDPAYNLKLPKPNVASTNIDDARASMKSVKFSDNQGDSLQPMRDLMKQSGGQKVSPSQVKAAQNAASDATADASNTATQAASDASNAVSSAASDATNAATQAASNATNAASSAASDATNAASSAASDATNAVSNAASNASNAVSNAVSDASNAAKNLISAQAKNALQISKASISGTEAAGEGALDTIGEVASESSLFDAIPVLGEAAAVAGGLFAIGDGLYHLFHHQHHDAPPPAPVTMSGNVLQQQLTSKYASALPSMDSANDHASNMF